MRRAILASAAIAAGAFAAPAFAACDGYPTVVAVRDGIYNNGLKVKASANSTLDFRGVTVRGQGGPTDALSVLTVGGFNNVCILGGRFVGKQDPQVVPWVVGHATYGAGILFKGGSGSILVENAVIENSLQDGINLSGGLPGNTTFGMRGAWIRNNSDDGIQNDGGKKILFIEDSLIESKMGLSIRPDADANPGNLGSYNIPIRNTLLNIICVADDRPDGSDIRNPAAAKNNNCGPSKAASQAFKWSAAAAGIGVAMTDSIIRYEARSRNGWGSMTWPKGTYRNVVVVWDPRVPGMKYAGPALPPGVTMTTDVSVWTTARNRWLQLHGQG